MKEIRIPFETMKSEFERILINNGFTFEKAGRCADVFATNSLEGVYSHGVNRFSRFINYIKKGIVNVAGKPGLIHSAGALEQWDGDLAPGSLNAEFSTNRAIELAGKNGIGCVAIANTNHWMRAGTYGWQAAKKGFGLIAWTNTEANMPAWGAKESRLGNNPMVFAVPFKNKAIVLDFAMTQFSYGKIETYSMNQEKLPFPGGFNKNGQLTDNPDEILESNMALPIGYWKGAGLSLLLDIFSAILSGGLASHEISKRKIEHGVSQVFIAFDLKNLHNYPSIEKSINEIISNLKKSVSVDERTAVKYPGERVAQLRTENLKLGIPVNRKLWEEICKL